MLDYLYCKMNEQSRFANANLEVRTMAGFTVQDIVTDLFSTKHKQLEQQYAQHSRINVYNYHIISQDLGAWNNKCTLYIF